jgi:hypothetical protein
LLLLNGTLKGCYDLVEETAVVVASVLDGTLEVLAGEVAGAEVLGRIHSRGGDVLNRGLDKGGSAVDVAADVIAIVVVSGMVATFGVVTARVDWRMNHRGSQRGVLDCHWSVDVVASVLDGTLEVLAGEVAGAEVLGRIHSRGGDVLNRGGLDKGSATQVAAVLHSTLEVLTRKVAGAINTSVQELRSIKRHLSS